MEPITQKISVSFYLHLRKYWETNNRIVSDQEVSDVKK
jgi:hypothetical protein